MNALLERCLDDLEQRLDPEEEGRLLEQWQAFVAGRVSAPVFDPRRTAQAPPRVAWPDVRVNDALADPEAMLLQQYRTVSDALASGSGLLPCVRANYGTSILPLLFGAEPFTMPDDMDMLPTSRPLGGRDAVREAIDRGIPAPSAGWGQAVLEVGARFVDVGRRWPRIGRCVWVYHPDLQGPLDAAELLWGSDLFRALYDEPALVHALLDVVTETYIEMMRAWREAVPSVDGRSVHWGFQHGGTLMLRLDSATNLSPAMVEEFSRPYDQRLLDAFGGGALHFCGRGDHFMPGQSRLRGLHAVNISQPHLNRMDVVLAHTIDRDIRIVGLDREAAGQMMATGADLRGVHVM